MENTNNLITSVIQISCSNLTIEEGWVKFEIEVLIPAWLNKKID